jgi:nucleoside phosphorylase
VKILVTFALENEFAPWREMRKFQRREWGATEGYFAKVGSAEVGVILTGIGSKHAGVESSKVIWGEYDSIDYCISSGFAGALKPEYRIGQTLVARNVFPDEQRADMENQTLASSEALVNLATECGAMPVEWFCTVNHVVSTPEEKRRLGSRFDAVEMETFEVMGESLAFGIAPVAIRTVSDEVDENLPLDFGKVTTDDGKVSLPRVLKEVARRPQSIPGLMRLGKHSRYAAESLAEFLDRYVVTLGKGVDVVGAKVTAAAR